MLQNISETLQKIQLLDHGGASTIENPDEEYVLETGHLFVENLPFTAKILG